MDNIIILFAAISMVSTLQYDGLRVKFGWSDAMQDIEYFFKIPRTVNDAEIEGWHRMEQPAGPLPELRMFCPPGRGLCPMYDAGGFIAGIMIAIPADEFEPGPVSPEEMFVKWYASEIEGEPSRVYWTSTQYFVSQESLKAGAGPQWQNGATLQDGGVWVRGPDATLIRIPSTEAELNSTTYRKQNCIPNMGIHYYFNMSRSMKCEDMLPWFALTTQGDLVGTGFQIFGRMPRQKYREWFEKVPSVASSIQLTIPFAPPCLVDWAEKYGVLSMHIYYVNEPWNIKCRNGDSIKPASPVDRFLLSGHKYMTQITDEVRKIFSG